jgi:hypothetical protein
MSALLQLLADDATVRGTTTPTGKRVFSVYDFISLVCQKHGVYSRKLWSRLISRDSKVKNEIKPLTAMLKLHAVGSFSSYKTPAMTIGGLQKLLPILGRKVKHRLVSTAMHPIQAAPLHHTPANA